MDIISAIVVGFIIGLLARAVLPGRDPMGFILTTLLGIVGAVLGSWLGRTFGWYQSGEAPGFVLSVVGAVLLLVLVRAFRRPHSPSV